MVKLRSNVKIRLEGEWRTLRKCWIILYYRWGVIVADLGQIEDLDIDCGEISMDEVMEVVEKWEEKKYPGLDGFYVELCNKYVIV